MYLLNPPARRTVCASAVALALVHLAVPAHAQEASQPEAMAQVTVTAQSRSQQIQNVPMAVQALSGDSLRAIGVTDLGELDAFVPGLSVHAEQPTRPQIFLRGIGTSDFGIGTDSPVGIYIDGVYTGKTGGSLLNFVDVKRVEVLKGPQGTLFGRNAAAGAIAVISNEPEQRDVASAVLRIGERGSHHEELLLNKPVSDNVALRISAINHDQRGWTRNTVNGERLGGDTDWGTRTALRWSDGATAATISWEHERFQASGPLVSSLTQGKINFGGPTAWSNPLGQPVSLDANPNAQGRVFDGVTVRVEHPLSFATLTSTTAYRHFNSFQHQDNDGSANPAAYLATVNRETNSSWQQELRLNGQAASLDWVAGVSAYRDRASQSTEASLTTTSIDTLVKRAAGLAPYATLGQLAKGIGAATGNSALAGTVLGGLPWDEAMYNNASTRAFAIYGDVIWHLGSATNLTIGARYTHDEKRFSWFNPARSAPALDSALASLKQAQLFPTAVALKLLTAPQAALLQSVTANNLQFGNPVSSKTPFSNDHSWNDVSPRLVLDHHLTPDHMLYASWTRGYQSGGFDAVGVNGRYEEERVSNIEAGAKGRVKTLGLSYSASVFHYAFSNLQSLTLVPASLPTGIPAYQIASSDQRATGVDMEAQWKLNRTWRLQGAAEYLNQKYGQFTSPTGVRLDGQAVGAPLWSASVGMGASWSALNGNADAQLMAAYTGERRCNADTALQGTCLHTDALDVGAAISRVDFRIGWEAPSKRWGLGLVVSNLTDKQTILGVSTLGNVVGSPYAYLSRPRSAALELRLAL